MVGGVLHYIPIYSIHYVLFPLAIFLADLADFSGKIAKNVAAANPRQARYFVADFSGGSVHTHRSLSRLDRTFSLAFARSRVRS